MRSVSSTHSGATLVELVMTIVIISIAIAGVVGAFSLIAGRSADPLNQTRSVALAQLAYDELASRYYDESTLLGGGEVDVDEVDCESLQGGDLNATSPYSGFSTPEPEIECAGNDFPALGLADEDLKKITIEITDPSGQTYVFSAYRGNF